VLALVPVNSAITRFCASPIDCSVSEHAGAAVGEGTGESDGEGSSDGAGLGEDEGAIEGVGETAGEGVAFNASVEGDGVTPVSGVQSALFSGSPTHPIARSAQASSKANNFFMPCFTAAGV